MTGTLTAIATRRVVTRTIMTLMFASTASGQARNVEKANALQPEAVQAQLAARPIPAEVTRRYQSMHSFLKPSASAWIEQQARLVSQRSSPDVPALEASIRNRFSSSIPSGIQGADIAAVVFIVMSEAAQDSENDLQKTMQEMQQQTKQKEALRNLVDSMQNLVAQNSKASPTTPCASPACESLLAQLRQSSGLPHPVRLPAGNKLTYGDIGQIQKQLQGDLDSLNDMSETQSLELQMTMDRRSKLIDTLSNVLKKISDTGDSVVQNLK